MCADRNDIKPSCAHSPVQFEDEHGVGQLGLVICPPRAVGVLALQVAEVDAVGLLVPVAADGYHAAAGAPRECRQEPAGQGEMAEMVGAKLAFVALRGGL